MAHKRFNKLDHQYKNWKKNEFVDGHEQEDLIEDHKTISQNKKAQYLSNWICPKLSDFS